MTNAALYLLQQIYNRCPVATKDGVFIVSKDPPCHATKTDEWVILPDEVIDECVDNGWMLILDDAVQITDAGIDAMMAENLVVGVMFPNKKGTKFTF